MNPQKSMIRWAAQHLARLFVRYPKLFVMVTLIYLISPVDFIPEGLLGPVGFLDDLLFLFLPFFLRESIKGYEEKNKPDSRHGKDYFDTTAR
jgi:uncharacterized membrane protein YkvA (DUF1232 family)